MAGTSLPAVPAPTSCPRAINACGLSARAGPRLAVESPDLALSTRRGAS